MHSAAPPKEKSPWLHVKHVELPASGAYSFTEQSLHLREPSAAYWPAEQSVHETWLSLLR